MRLLETRIERADGVVRLVGVLERSDGRADEVYLGFDEAASELVADTADAFLPALLVPCLWAGETLRIEPKVSRTLVRHLPRIQDIYLSWFPRLKRIAVEVTAAPERPAAGTKVGTFFSGGVDSFYTLHRSRQGAIPGVPAATHLVFLLGYDRALERLRGQENTWRYLEDIAARYQTGLIRGTTNLRSVFPIDSAVYHGAMLAAGALALSRGLRHVLVPATYQYGHLMPCGSHPLLDELWSTEQLEVVHHGCDATRVGKLEALAAEDPQALAGLRVCPENYGDVDNCGRCPKCIRTMVALDLIGWLSRVPTLPSRLPDGAQQILREDASDHESTVSELLEAARRPGQRPELRRLVEGAWRRRRRRQALRSFLENTPVLQSGLAWVDGIRGRRR
jgi:hypothetical protein